LGRDKGQLRPVELESDEELEIALRRELAEMVRASGVSDADVLLDMLSEKGGDAQPQSRAPLGLEVDGPPGGEEQGVLASISGIVRAREPLSEAE